MFRKDISKKIERRTRTFYLDEVLQPAVVVVKRWAVSVTRRLHNLSKYLHSYSTRLRLPTRGCMAILRLGSAMFVGASSPMLCSVVRRNLASAAYTDFTQNGATAIRTTPHNITPQQREALDSALRVDQAGEIAANWIYHGQSFILDRDPSTGPLIRVSHIHSTRLTYNLS